MALAKCPILLLAMVASASCRGFFYSGKTYDFSQIPKTTRIKLYYESLCPYSIAFITEQLWPTYIRMGYLMDVELYPFGNAFQVQEVPKEEHNRESRFAFRTPRVDYTCQHGPEECFGNTVQACAAHLFNDTLLTLAFVACMSSASEPDKAGKSCAGGVARDWSQIQRCATGKRGQKLNEKMSQETWNLDPPHNYVPWIVVNDVHTDDQQSLAQTDLLRLVCDSVSSGSKPPPCLEDKEKRMALYKLSNTIEKETGDDLDYDESKEKLLNSFRNSPRSIEV